LSTEQLQVTENYETPEMVHGKESSKIFNHN